MKSLESELNQMRSAFGSLRHLSYLMEDPEKAVKLDQILSNVDVDDLIMAVEMFKETAEDDEINATNMTGNYGPPMLDNSLAQTPRAGNFAIK